MAVGVNLLLYGLTAPFAAALMDRFGVRAVTSCALVLVALGSGLTVFVTAGWQLVLFWGVLIGLGTGSMALVFAATIAGRWFVRHRGLVMGMLTAASATGQLIFLPLMAWLAERYGWRAASLMVSVAALAVVPLVLRFVRNYPADLGVRPYGAPDEPAGQVAIGVYGVDRESTNPAPSPGHLARGDDGEIAVAPGGSGSGAVVGSGAGVGSGAVVGSGAGVGSGAVVGSGAGVGSGAVVGSGAGVGSGAVVGSGAGVGSGAVVGSGAGVESGAVVRVGAVRRTIGTLTVAARTRTFWALAVGFAICGATTNGLIGTHFVPAAQDHGMPATTAAGLLAVVGIFDVVGTIASGALTDRINPRILLAFYYAMRGVGLLMLPSLLSDSLHPSILAFVIVYGLDWVATVPPTAALCAEAFGEAGTIVFGWVFAAHMIGAALASAGAGYLRDLTSDTPWPGWARPGCAVAALMSLGIRKVPRVGVAVD